MTRTAYPLGSTDDHTYSNVGPQQPLTMSDVAAAARQVRAIPVLPSDITVAPDVFEALRASPAALAAAAGGRVTIHCDERLPPGFWHRGKPNR